MKLFTTIFVLCSAILYVKSQDFSKEKVTALANECKDEVGASEADIEAMMKHEPAGTKEGKCLHACTMKKLGVMNEAGKFDKEVGLNVAKFLAKGDAEQEKLGVELVEACAGIDVDSDACEASEQYGTCMREKAKEIGYTLKL